MIQHIVVFNLKHQKNSVEEQAFFHFMQELALITEVKNLKITKQISQKTSFQYALSMNFENYNSYQNYLMDDRHESFVQNYWLTEVTDFMELDLAPLSNES